MKQSSEENNQQISLNEIIKTQNRRKISQSLLLEKIFSNLFSGGRGFSKSRRDSNPQRYLGGDIETGLHIDLIFYEETKSVQKA